MLIYVSLCICIYICACVYIYMHMYISRYMHLYICMYIHMHMYISSNLIYVSIYAIYIYMHMYVYTIYIYVQYIHVLILSHAQPEFSLSSPKEWSKAVAASSLSRQQRHSQNRVFESSGTREFQERSLSTLCQPSSLEWVPQRSL